MFFHTIDPPLLITMHSTEGCKHKNNNKKISACNIDQLKIFILMGRTTEVEREVYTFFINHTHVNV